MNQDPIFDGALEQATKFSNISLVDRPDQALIPPFVEWVANHSIVFKMLIHAAEINRHLIPIYAAGINEQVKVDRKALKEACESFSADIDGFITSMTAARNTLSRPGGGGVQVSLQAVYQRAMFDSFLNGAKNSNKLRREQLIKDIAEKQTTLRNIEHLNTQLLERLNVSSSRLLSLLSYFSAESNLAFKRLSDISSHTIAAQKARARQEYFATLNESEQMRHDLEVQYIEAISRLKSQTSDFAVQQARLTRLRGAVDALDVHLRPFGENKLSSRVFVSPDSGKTRAELLEKMQVAAAAFPANDARRVPALAAIATLTARNAAANAQVEGVAKELDAEMELIRAKYFPRVVLSDVQKRVVESLTKPLVAMKAELGAVAARGRAGEGLRQDAAALESMLSSSIAEIHRKFEIISELVATKRRPSSAVAPRRCTGVVPPGPEPHVIYCARVGDLASAIMARVRIARGGAVVDCCAFHHDIVERKFGAFVVRETCERRGRDEFTWQSELEGVPQ